MFESLGFGYFIFWRNRFRGYLKWPVVIFLRYSEHPLPF